MFLSFNSNTMGVTCGAGTTNPSMAPEFTSCYFCGVCVARSLVFYVMFCGSLSVLWCTASGHTFGIFDVRLLVTPLVSLMYGFWSHLWYLRCTASGHTFGILDVRLLVTPLVSLMYDFWSHLWYLQSFLDSS